MMEFWCVFLFSMAAVRIRSQGLVCIVGQGASPRPFLDSAAAAAAPAFWCTPDCPIPIQIE